MSFLIHEQLNGYRLTAERNRPIWIQSLASLAVIFYLLEFVCRHSCCALMQKVSVLASYFLFRLYPRGMSVKTPREIPHTLFSVNPHKASIPGTNWGICLMWGYLDSEMGNFCLNLSGLFHLLIFFTHFTDCSYRQWSEALKLAYDWKISEMVSMFLFFSHNRSGLWLHFSHFSRQDLDFTTLRNSLTWR